MRLLCTDGWPTLYSMLAIRTHDPVAVWKLPKADAIALLPADETAGGDIRRFYDSVLEYYPAQDSVPGALQTIERGVAFLDSAREWYGGLYTEGEST